MATVTPQSGTPVSSLGTSPKTTLPMDINIGGKSIDILQKERDVQGSENQEPNTYGDQTFMSSSFHTESRLAGHIKRHWERNRRARLSIDDRLLFCLRSRRGEYSITELQSILNNGGADPVFLKLTGTKCRAASAWIRDIILPAGERPWALEPTTESDFPQEVQDGIRKAALAEVQQLIQQGIMNPNQGDIYDFIQKVRTKVEEKLQDDAKEAAEAMEDRIDDKMDEGNWDNALEEFIEDFVTYPTAFLKGPYFKAVNQLEWSKDFKPVVKKVTQMYWSRVSPFDMFPSPHSRNMREGDLIERLRLTQEHLYGMIGLKGYSEERIRNALDNFEKGTIKDWIWEEFERERLESDTSYFTSEPDTVDALHYWGTVKGDVLIEWGMLGEEEDSIDPQKPYEIDAILVGNDVIRAVINDDPLGMRPYHHACWDAVPSAIWGVSLPEQMEDHQKIVNACARAMCNNMAIASGPQITILVDQLAENEDVTGISPFKIWQMKSSMTGNSGRPVDFYQPDMHTTELLNVLNTFEQKADDVTNVPRYSYGNQQVGGAGSTASGLSMLLNSAAKGIRRAISHIDANVIRPSVYQSFVYLMLNDPDPTIKGDCKIVPRGATALLIKEQTQVRVQQFMSQTMNPVDQAIIGVIGRGKLLRESAKLLDLPHDIVPDDDTLKAQQAQQQAMQQQMMAQQQQEQQAKMGGPQGGPNMTQGAGNDSQMLQNSQQPNGANPTSP